MNVLLARESGPIMARETEEILLAQGAAFDVSGEIALNTTHREGDGSDHADVALNTTHRGRTDNPHVTTKTHVGLGNVTDDAQLKRAAGDFNTFGAKPTPADADVFLFENSAASFAKVKATWANIKAELTTVFNLLYAAIFNTLKLGTITGPVTINPVTASTYTGDFSANFTATFTGFTAARKSVLIHLEKSGVTLRTIAVTGYTFHFMTDLNLTDMEDGTYQIVANNPNTDTEVYLYVTKAP